MVLKLEQLLERPGRSPGGADSLASSHLQAGVIYAMKQSVVYIGVDAVKAHLDVAWEKRSRRFPNDKSGRAALVASIKQSPTAVQLICEASGGYEQRLLESLEQGGLKVTLVQANRVRQYARAAGILSKTDKVDARVLSAFGAAMQPSQRCLSRPNKSDCANTKHSVGI